MMNNLKKALTSKSELSLGSWITIPNRTIAEIMKEAGFDWLCIDLEHTVITIEQAGDLIATIDSPNCSPLVRLSSNDSVQIKKVMDQPTAPTEPTVGLSLTVKGGADALVQGGLPAGCHGLRRPTSSLP